jgi:hypothetical protein
MLLVFHTKIVVAYLLQCVAAGVWKQENDGEYRVTQLCNSRFM